MSEELRAASDGILSKEQIDEIRENENKQLDDAENFRLDKRADDVKIGDRVYVINKMSKSSNRRFEFSVYPSTITSIRTETYLNHRGNIAMSKDVIVNGDELFSTKQIIVDFERVKQIIDESLDEYKRNLG